MHSAFERSAPNALTEAKKSPNVPCDFIFTTCFRRWVRPEGLWASQINLSVHAGFGELVPFYKCVGYKYGKIITNISGIISSFILFVLLTILYPNYMKYATVLFLHFCNKKVCKKCIPLKFYLIF